MKIFISIVNYNGLKNTKECLEAIRCLKHSNIILSVVVIDNSSKEEFYIEEKEYQDISLKVIRASENKGFSGGQNLGIIFALKNNADAVLVLNNDIAIDPFLLQFLTQALFGKEKIGIVVPKIYFAKGKEFHKDRYTKEQSGSVIWHAGGGMDWENVFGVHRGVNEVDIGQYNIPEVTDGATGCCMLVKREIFGKIGYFDERYFLYYEDADFSERAKKAGYEIYYEPRAILWHKNAASGGGAGSILHDYYLSRNRMLFGMRYASLRTKFALFRESIAVLYNGRKWQRNGVRDFYLRRFGKGSFPV